MVSDKEGKIVAAPDKRGLRLLDRNAPVRRWMSAKKWIDVEDLR